MKGEACEDPVLRSSLDSQHGRQTLKTAFKRGNKVTELILTT